MEKTLLVVDDDRDTVEVVSAVLEEAGYIVKYYTDPLQALAETDAVCLAIVDCIMPKVDGIQWIKMARAQHKDMRFLMISAMDSRHVAEMAEVIGVPWLTKPCSYDQLVGVVDQLTR